MLAVVVVSKAGCGGAVCVDVRKHQNTTTMAAGVLVGRVHAKELPSVMPPQEHSSSVTALRDSAILLLGVAHDTLDLATTSACLCP